MLLDEKRFATKVTKGIKKYYPKIYISTVSRLDIGYNCLQMHIRFMNKQSVESYCDIYYNKNCWTADQIVQKVIKKLKPSIQEF